jgi:hypothetical protein
MRRSCRRAFLRTRRTCDAGCTRLNEMWLLLKIWSLPLDQKAGFAIFSLCAGAPFLITDRDVQARRCARRTHADSRSRRASAS